MAAAPRCRPGRALPYARRTCRRPGRTAGAAPRPRRPPSPPAAPAQRSDSHLKTSAKLLQRDRPRKPRLPTGCPTCSSCSFDDAPPGLVVVAAMAAAHAASALASTSRASGSACTRAVWLCAVYQSVQPYSSLHTVGAFEWSAMVVQVAAQPQGLCLGGHVGVEVAPGREGFAPVAPAMRLDLSGPLARKIYSQAL